MLPLQGLAGLIAQVVGPTHTHSLRAEAAQTFVDFRREGTWSADARLAAISARHGHSHAHDGADRHHHAVDDASVVYVDGDRFGDASPHDSASKGDSGGAFLPLHATLSPMFTSGASHRYQPDLGWSPTEPDLARLERPPQSALA